MTVTEYSTRSGAHELARKIYTYWAQKGRPDINVEVFLAIEATESRHYHLYGVKSNLKNGYPPSEEP